MEVKKAKISDIPALLKFAKAFHERGAFADKPFNEAGAVSYLEAILSDANARVFMHEKGCIGASIERAEMNSGYVLRERFFMAIDKTGGPLLAAFHSFGAQMGVKVFALSMITAGGIIPEKLDKYYRANGYELAECVYSKRVD